MEAFRIFFKRFLLDSYANSLLSTKEPLLEVCRLRAPWAIFSGTFWSSEFVLFFAKSFHLIHMKLVVFLQLTGTILEVSGALL